MTSKHARRRTSRNRSIESLEARQVMSADPLSQLLGGSIVHHAVQDAAGEPPALVHHDQRDADFWIDSSSERDVDALVGDIQQTLASAHTGTGLTQVRNDYGFIGTGQTVAIIDSGIAWDHAALGGGFGADYRVVGGWDFSEENDATPYDDGPEGSHGTHVAGIVGGDRTGTVDDGVAPGVDLVALRVFNDAGAGYFSWVENALRWVHTNRDAFENPITAVNLSLGAPWNSTSVPSWGNLEDEFAQLEADGIFIAVSAGNSFSTYNAPGLAYPAASPYVVPVMSVRDNGTFSTFSQRHPTAIAAPGQGIVSTVPDYVGNQNGITDDYASNSGTSMAAPYVAGASVLVREAMQFVGYANITQDTIFDHMMATATEFFDSATGLNYKRLNMANALNTLMPSDDYGSSVATAYNLGTVGVGGSEMSGLIGTLSDADYFQFTASVTGTVTLTADTTHRLAPVWNGSGAVSGSDGQIFTFEVVAGQSYNFGIATTDGIGYYDIGIALDAAALPPPSMPDGLQAAATSPTQVALSWFDCEYEASYQIARWSSATGTTVVADVGADVTGYTVDNLPPDSRQFFMITARNSAGSASTGWQLVVMPQVPPNAPGSMQVVVASPTSAVLNWSDSTGEREYQIARWSAATGTTVVGMAGANATSYTVNNLPPDSRQFFMVTARNSAGSASTSWQLAQMPQAIPPSVPATLEVVANSPTEVAVSWSAANGADRYHVVHWTNTTGTRVVATVDAGVTNYVMTDAAPATRHWFRIEASNSSGKVSTAWQIAQTPSASIATAVAVNSDLAALNGFSIDASPLTLHASSNIAASGLATRQAWQSDKVPSFSLSVTRAADDLDSRLDAFGEWQGDDSSLDWRGDDADELLLETLAESALAATHGEPDDAAIAQAWQNL